MKLYCWALILGFVVTANTVVRGIDVKMSSANSVHVRNEFVRTRRLHARHTSIDHDVNITGNNTPDVVNDQHANEHRYHVASFDFAYVSTPFIVSLWIVFASVAKIVFHIRKRLSSIFPESCLLIVIGVALGLLMYVAGQTDYHLNASTFFLILLPPIILDAGYFMPTRAFFDNIGTILLFAIAGTLWNTVCIGLSLWGLGSVGAFVRLSPMHALVFASLLAAVDPVAVLAVFEEIHVKELLHIVVLGESLLNDGIAVVLYRMFEGFSEIGTSNIILQDVVACMASFAVIVFGSPLIGILCGFCGGLMSRFTYRVRVIEPLIVFVFGYLSFLSAEMFHLSGILSCISCAITMKRYIEANMSLKSHTTVKYFMKMLASVCESIVFMYLGISVVSDVHHWDTVFVLSTLIACIVFRTLGVLLLSAYINRLRVEKLDCVDQFIMSYGGLRGAVAFALVVLLREETFPHRHMFITTTVTIIYFTNFILGSTIKPLVRFLKVKRGEKHKPSMNEKIALRCLDHVMAGIEDITGHPGHHLFRERFLALNSKYIKPLLIRKHEIARPRGWSLLDVCQKLTEKDTRQLLQASSASYGSQLDNNHHLAAPPSIARLFSSSSLRLNFGYSSWRRSSSDISHPASGLPSTSALPDVGSSTCLDLQALDVQETRKMRDDSKIHHIVDDLVARPRKKVTHCHHPAPQPTSSQPAGTSTVTTDTAATTAHVNMMTPHDHHRAPVHLRHVLSYSQWCQMMANKATVGGPVPGATATVAAATIDTTAAAATAGGGTCVPVENGLGICNGGILSHVTGIRPNKSVSFAQVESILHEPLEPEVDAVSLVAQEGDKVSSDSDDEGIFFTVPTRTVNTTNAAAAAAVDDGENTVEEELIQTAVESSLPWKRNTGREPMSSVATHTMPDDSHPMRADYSNIPSMISSSSDNWTIDQNPVDDSFGLPYDSPVVDSELNVSLDAHVGIIPDVGTSNNRTISNASQEVKSHAGEGSSGIDEIPDIVPLPPPWKTSRKSDTHLSTARNCNQSSPTTRRSSFPVLAAAHDETDSYSRFLPWRHGADDPATPDQHAPRPPLTSTRPSDFPCSPSQSCIDGISMHPQASCQSFRLSEAESRHSEPFHLHHVIDMPPPCHRLPSSPVHDTEPPAGEVLSNLEEFDSRERIFLWLDTLTEYSDDTSEHNMGSQDDGREDIDDDDVSSDIVNY